MQSNQFTSFQWYPGQPAPFARFIKEYPSLHAPHRGAPGSMPGVHAVATHIVFDIAGLPLDLHVQSLVSYAPYPGSNPKKRKESTPATSSLSQQLGEPNQAASASDDGKKRAKSTTAGAPPPSTQSKNQESKAPADSTTANQNTDKKWSLILNKHGNVDVRRYVPPGFVHIRERVHARLEKEGIRYARALVGLSRYGPHISGVVIEEQYAAQVKKWITDRQQKKKQAGVKAMERYNKMTSDSKDPKTWRRGAGQALKSYDDLPDVILTRIAEEFVDPLDAAVMQSLNKHFQRICPKTVGLERWKVLNSTQQVLLLESRALAWHKSNNLSILQRKVLIQSTLQKWGVSFRSDSQLLAGFINGTIQDKKPAHICAIMRGTSYLFNTGGHKAYSKFHECLKSHLLRGKCKGQSWHEAFEAFDESKYDDEDEEKPDYDEDHVRCWRCYGTGHRSFECEC